MQKTAVKYPVEAVCRAVRVSRSGYYAWAGRRADGKPEMEVRLAATVEAVFWRHARRLRILMMVNGDSGEREHAPAVQTMVVSFYS